MCLCVWTCECVLVYASGGARSLAILRSMRSLLRTTRFERSPACVPAGPLASGFADRLIDALVDTYRYTHTPHHTRTDQTRQGHGQSSHALVRTKPSSRGLTVLTLHADTCSA